jgi:hypothetical protein
MATTTNYGWDTPDDTDLVKDGAAAIRTLGSSVDTTTKALNPETTEGDIAYRSATANTNTRLALGTAGQVLTVNSGEDAPEWATAASGSMTLLASGTFSSSALSLTSISGAYIDLVLIFENYAKNATDTNIRFNSDTASNYAWAQYATGLTSFNQTTSSTALQINQPSITTGTPNSLYMTIYNYANTNSHKAITTLFNGSPQGTKNAVWAIHTYASTSAIDGILTTDAMTSGSYKLYGVK